jgi:hypothetical protein
LAKGLQSIVIGFADSGPSIDSVALPIRTVVANRPEAATMISGHECKAADLSTRSGAG